MINFLILKKWPKRFSRESRPGTARKLFEEPRQYEKWRGRFLYAKKMKMGIVDIR